MKNGEKVTVVGSTGNKYVVSKKNGMMLCSCPRWTTTVPRENCKHIKSALSGVPVAKVSTKVKNQKENTMKAKAGKLAPKVVVKAHVKATQVAKAVVNIKSAAEVIFGLIKKSPGKLLREDLREKTGWNRSVVKAACEQLWAAKRIYRANIHKGKANGAYILRTQKA